MPSALSFRIIATVEVTDESEVPIGYTGRVRFVDGAVVKAIGWYDRGVLDDPGRRIPAYVRLRADGRVKQSRHYRLGRLHDPAKDEPAVQGFFSNGALRYAEHYRYGRRQDGPDGTPAITKWRRDGSVRSVKRYPRLAR